MPTVVEISSSGPTGESQRAGVFSAGNSFLTGTDFALAEVPAGSGNFYGSASIALSDLIAGLPYKIQARAVTAQTAAGFTNSASARTTFGKLGWVFGGVLLSDPAFAGVRLADSEHEYIAQEAMGLPGMAMRYVTQTGSNTNAGTIRAPWADPSYGSKNTGSNSTLFTGPGWFEIDTNQVVMATGANFAGCGIDVTTISSTADEVVVGAIFKPGSNSFSRDASVYGHDPSFGTTYSHPIGCIAKTGTNGQSIPNNFSIIRMRGYSKDGADAFLFQTKNSDISPCNGRLIDCVGDSQFDSLNVGLSNQGLNWPFRLDVDGGRFSAVDAGSGYTIVRAVTIGVGTLNLRNTQLISTSTNSLQVTTVAVNNRPQNSAFRATVNMHGVSCFTSGTAGVIGDILIGQTPTVGTSGGSVNTANCAYVTTLGGPITSIPVNSVAVLTSQTNGGSTLGQQWIAAAAAATNTGSAGDMITSEGESVSSTDAIT